MSARIVAWWQSMITLGAPVFPYIGLVLLILLGILALCIVLYLLYRLFKRMPPMVRYFAWRVATLARRLMARKPVAQLQQLLAGFAGIERTVPMEYSFGARRVWPWAPVARREPVPLFVVVGSSGSGKSALLRAATTGLSAISPARLDGESNPSWWRLDKAMALEIPAWLFSTAAQGQFARLQHVLQRLRPECPLDGVIVTLPAEQLLQGGAGQESEFGRLAEAISQLCVASGHRIPLYVVVTGTEQLAGFREFAQVMQDADAVNDLHWINPAPFERVELDQALSIWCDRMRATALATIASSPLVKVFAERNRALLFPAQVMLLKPSLSIWLTQVKINAQQNQGTPVLRGVFLSGLSAPQSGISPARLAFIGTWLGAMLFAAEPRPQPTPQFLARRQRRVAIALAALAGSVVVSALWVPATISRIRSDVDAMHVAIRQNRSDLGAAARTAPPTANAEDPSRIARLLGAIIAVSRTAPAALLAPDSWFDDTRAGLLARLGDAIQRALIAPRLDTLAHDSPYMPPEMLLPIRGVAAEKVDQLPAYIALQGFLKGRELTGTAVQMAESMPQGITYQDLVRFLGDNPDRFRKVSWDWEDLLPVEVIRRFHTDGVHPAEDLRPEVKQLVAAYWERLLQEGLDGHPLVLLSDDVGELIAKLGRNQNFSYRDAIDLDDRLRRLRRESEHPNARRLLGKMTEALNFFGAVLARLGSSAIVTMEQATDASTSLAQHREAVRRRLLSYESSGIGHLFVADAAEGTLALSPEMKRFTAAYGTLMTQSFMQHQLRDESTRDRPASDIRWNLGELESVKDIAAAARDYSTTGIQSFDPVLRPSLLRLVQLQARGAVDAVYWHAAHAVDNRDNAQDKALAGLRPQVANLIAAVRLYRQAFAADETQDILAGSVAELLIAEMQRLLNRLDLLLKEEDPYGSIIAETRRWMISPAPGRPLGSVVRGNSKERLALARDYVRTQYATQVALLLDGLNSMAAGARRDDSFQYWRRFMETLDGFDKGATANGLYEFEQYLLNMARWGSPDDCVRFLAERTPLSWRSDYFSSRLAALDETVVDTCARRTAEGGRHKYEGFANWFNAQIAGHPPFGADPSLAPLSRRSFSAVLLRYRDLGKQGLAAAKEWPQPVLQFLGQIDNLSERFGPIERAKPGSVPATETSEGVVHARLQLRSNRAEAVLADQIIDAVVLSGPRPYGVRNAKEVFEWRMGEPLEIRLRWAAQSPYTPVAAQDGHEGYSVSERSVIFRFAGDWAFFDLLRQYAVRGDGYDQAVLRLPVNVVGPEGRRVTQFFLTFSAPDEQSPLALDFPERAPVLPIPVETPQSSLEQGSNSQ